LRKYIKINNGILELVILRNGRLVLGEIKEGFATQQEIKTILKENDIVCGYIDNNIKLIENGQKAQIPLATDYLEYEPAEIEKHLANKINKNIALGILNNSTDNIFNFSHKIKKGEKLLTLNLMPELVIRYPDGNKKSIKKLDSEKLKKFSGENTIFNMNQKSVSAAIDGSFHYSIYAIAYVYPLLTLQSINYSHGEIKYKNALQIESNIQEESRVKIPSNLIVKGYISCAFIDTGGSVHCLKGIENQKKIESSKLKSGQNIYTNLIKNFDVWAGDSVIVKDKIDECRIECLNTIICPEIVNSEIRVGNKLYTKDIINSSRIYLGSSYVNNEHLNKFRNIHKQHKKKMNDLDNILNEEKTEMELIRSKLTMQIKKMRKTSLNNFNSDIVINRFFNRLINSLQKFNDNIKIYNETLKLIENEKNELIFLEQQSKSKQDTEIIICGRIEPGSAIYAPNQTLRINKTLKNISIKLDSVRGTLKINSL